MRRRVGWGDTDVWLLGQEAAFAAPLARLKSPGAAVTAGTETVLLVPPLYSTETFTFPDVGVAHGTWKLICPGDT